VIGAVIFVDMCDMTTVIGAAIVADIQNDVQNWQKSIPQYSAHKFVKYCLIFKIPLLSQSVEKMQ